MDTIVDLNKAAGDDGSLPALLRKSVRALTQPGRFFRVDFPAMDAPTLLAFGIANAWASAAIAFFVQTLNSLLLSRLLDRWMQRLLSSEDGFDVWNLSAHSFLYTSGLLLLSPFILLLQALFCAGGLYLFARVLIEDRPGAPEPVTYGAALRIQATSLVSNWYSLVPVFGGLLSFIVGLVLSVTGVRERFGVSTRRATAVVLAPYLLLFVAAIILSALLVVAVSQLPIMDLFDMEPGQFSF